MRRARPESRRRFLGLLSAGAAGSCARGPQAPSIEFTRLPQFDEGGPDKLDTIEGRVHGPVEPGQRIVLYARSGTWWVQPTVKQPYTAVNPDGTWSNSTHLGTEYAAFLVTPAYRPAAVVASLPGADERIAARLVARGSARPVAAPRSLHFSGYEWEIRQLASDRGGTRSYYDAANAFTDAAGALHLRIARQGDRWTCGEVRLRRSLGYGSYSFTVRETAHFEPATVLGMFTYDASGPESREVDIEISRWGDPGSRSAQFVVQPYYIPANAVRFDAPPGRLVHSFRWEPGRVSFTTRRASSAGPVVASHIFTSGVPSPGNESVCINLYGFANDKRPLTAPTEVILEKFEYLP